MKSQTHNIYKFTIFFLYIYSMYPWFTWSIKPIIITSVTFAVIVIHTVFHNKYYILKSKYLVSLFFLFLMIAWESLNSNFFGKMNSGLTFIAMSSIICLKDNYKIELVNYITKWFAILLGISFLCYVMFLFNIPQYHEIYAYKEALHEGYVFDNYYTFVVPTIRFFSYTRFQSIFLEPGHLTMGLAILSFINRYNIKNKYVLILILVQLFTLSLAGYVLLCLGFLFFTFSSLSINKEKIQRFIFITTIVAGSIFLVNSIFSNNVIETAILNRLEYTNGVITGDNRTNSYFDNIYNQVIDSPDKWTGIEWNQYAYGGNSGYKKYIVSHGIIGVCLVLLFYTFTILNIRERETAGLALILYSLLYQNAYPTWWCVFLSVILGTSYLQSKYKNQE